jgi:hypothetical protein
LAAEQHVVTGRLVDVGGMLPPAYEGREVGVLGRMSGGALEIEIPEGKRPLVLKVPARCVAFYHYVWEWQTVLGDRRGQRCRIITSGTRCTSLLEFEDGFRVLTSRRGLRRAS